MGKIFLLLIKLYWKIIPPSNRNVCIFSESCSKYVFRKITEDGFLNGCKAFIYRYKNCRGGYVIERTSENDIKLKLVTGKYLDKHEINKNIYL